MPATKITISLPASLHEEVKAYDISPSAVCQAALRAAVEEAEDNRRKIVVLAKNGPEPARREGFYGRWIIDPDDEAGLTKLTGYRGEGVQTWPADHHHAVALTERRHIAVYIPETLELKFYRTLNDLVLFPGDVLERVLELANQPEEAPIFWHADQ